MRQSAQQVDNTVSWKQEVNRRVAEHKGRKGQAGTGQETRMEVHPASSLAAKAAARVAARYAKAPSYSEMLADEARAAVRAAEAASRAALEAQAAAESVLAGLEAASSVTQAWEPPILTVAAPAPVWTPAVAAAKPAAPAARQVSPKPGFEIRWDADLPVRETRSAVAYPSHGESEFELHGDGSWDETVGGRNPQDGEGFAVVEPAQPIPANLIEFPRELVATRKMRPRRAEGPYAAQVEAQGQLSIFEVDPVTISTEPAATGAVAEIGMETWAGPEWSGIELDEEPEAEMVSTAPSAARVDRAEPAEAAVALQVAAINRRLMAAVVDFSLIASAFLATAMAALSKADTLPTIKAMELGSAVALPLIGVLYLALFLTLAKATPGMKYARLEICTLGGERPARAQRIQRMTALLLSMLPLGLGGAWAVFDEQHLCWHDRMSGTYLRKR